MEFISFTCADTTLIFDKSNGYLKKIMYKNFILDTDSVIWKVEVRNGDNTIEVTAFDKLEFYDVLKESSLELIWKNECFCIKVTIDIEDSKFKWGIHVESFLEEHRINKIIFPVIENIKTISVGGENDYLVLPWQNGWLIRNPINTFFNDKEDKPFWSGRGVYKYENEYPAQYSFQFTSYYSPDKFGYYFCTEDDEAYIKTLGYYYDKQGDSFSFAISNYPENMGNIHEYHMPYKFVLYMFEGDWQTAVAIYREWAIQQKWCASKLINKHLPESLIKTDLWRINHTNYNLGTRTQEYFDTAVLLKDKLNCNIALHWYGWNMGKHDVNYPEYMNKNIKGWPEQLTGWNEKFTEKGIVKIPYVNARLWDENTVSWVRENAKFAGIKDESMQLLDEPWNPITILRPMCPATLLWQDKVKDFCNETVKQYKFDGLYIDQVGSYNATLCFDTDHNHPVGGGKWWNDSYHKMISGVRNLLGENRILTTESNCESYIDLFDLFLILDTNLQKLFLFTEYENCESIPLFSMIYGDYALSYGSICRFSDTLEEFEFNFIRNLLWGVLPTVEGVDQNQLNDKNAESYLDILRKGIRFFKDNKDLILFGKLQEIPLYESKSMTLEWIGTEKSFSKEFPSVMAVIWEDSIGEKYCLAYNFADYDQIINIKKSSICLKGKELMKIPISR